MCRTLRAATVSLLGDDAHWRTTHSPPSATKTSASQTKASDEVFEIGDADAA
jgi:hypothetical protein